MSGFTPEQLDARRSTLGASEIPAVIGISPYKGAFEVWLEKRGLAEPRSDDTPWQRWGLKMEPVLADAYLDYMRETHDADLILTGDGRTSRQIPDSPWACTPDRLVEDAALNIGMPVNNPFHWGVDFKQSRYGEGYGLSGSEDVPAHVYTQCQWSMFVTGLERWDVAALIGGSDFRVFHLMRNHEHICQLLIEARAFWVHVEDGTEPPLDASRGAKRYLAARFPEDEAMDPLPVYDDAATLALFQELRLIKAEASRANDRQEALENQIKLLIGSRPGIVTPVGRATWKKTKDSEKTDWEALARCVIPLPKLTEVSPQFTSVKPGVRRFLFTPTPLKEDS